MIERVIFTGEADDDVAESYDWYERLELGLGEDFLRCVEACVLTIQRHPHLYPVAVDDFRRALVRRFPYEVFYEATTDAIVIYSVSHWSQQPVEKRFSQVFPAANSRFAQIYQRENLRRLRNLRLKNKLRGCSTGSQDPQK